MKLGAEDLMASQLAEQLEAKGFQHQFEFPVAAIEYDLHLLGVDSTGSGSVGLLVGSGKALWQRFVESVHAEPERLKLEHPLDAFVEQAITSALTETKTCATVIYGHVSYGGAYAPLQRWAQQGGFLAMSPSHLSVHPEFGPWLALRAVILLTGELWSGRPTTTCVALEPCANCSAPCVAPFEAARLASRVSPGATRVTNHWQDWLKVRDACPVGREHRYSEEQIRYHYARDRSVLTSR